MPSSFTSPWCRPTDLVVYQRPLSFAIVICHIPSDGFEGTWSMTLTYVLDFCYERRL